MKDKIKKIFTIILLLCAVLFGFSWVKSCNNAKDIKTYEKTAQTRQNAPKKANDNERISINMIFDSIYIDKIVIEEYEGTEYLPNENNQIVIDFYSFQASRDYILDIYYKSDIAYFYSTNDFTILRNAFNYSNYDYFSIPSAYTLSYPYSKLTFEYYEEELENTTTTQNIFVTLNDNYIRHNFNYLTNKSIILNSSLSSQFGDNIYNIASDTKGIALSNTGGTYTSSNQSTSGFIKLEPNTTYHISNAQWYNFYTSNNYESFTRQSSQLIFTTTSEENYIRITHLTSVTEIMLNKNSYALPYHKYIDISDNNNRVRILTKNNNLNDRTFATYFFASSYKPLIPKNDLIPVISLENNSLSFAIGTGTETTLQEIYDYNNNVYNYAYGLVPRTLSFSNQFTHDNLECAVLDYYQEGYADYENEILITEYLLNNSQPFTTEQIDTYNIGYQIGKSDGIYQALEWTNLIKELAKSLESFLNIQILPNITIKLLILVPIMFSILSFIIKLFVK